jgi:hypothetical protein
MCFCSTKGSPLSNPEGYGLVYVDGIDYDYQPNTIFDVCGVWYHQPSDTYYYARDAGIVGKDIPFASTHVHQLEGGGLDTRDTLFPLTQKNFDVFATDMLHWWVDPRSNKLVLNDTRNSQAYNLRIANFINGIRKVVVGDV